MLATKLTNSLNEDEVTNVVGVGTSGDSFARLIKPGAETIKVVTKRYDRVREKRELEIVPRILDYKPVLVDDVAVSGLTLSLAAQRVSPEPITAAVGLMLKSKTACRRIAIADLRSGLVYSRVGGGTPPINSISSLQEFPERLSMLSSRYFGDKSEEIKMLIREIDQ